MSESGNEWVVSGERSEGAGGWWRRAGAVAMALMLAQCACQSNQRPTETGGAGGLVVPEPVRPAAGKGDGEVAPSAAAKPEPTSQPGGAGHAAKPSKVELPAGIDTKDLDEAEKALLAEVLGEQYDPCGGSKSFLESLRAEAPCKEAVTLANLAVAKIADGLSKRQVVEALLKEQSRWAKKVEFDLTGSPFVGDPATARKVMVEFFDYQCPHCKLAAKPAKELAKKHQAVLYYKMLPLEHHPAAKEAALVALAAHRQGRFEALHELFFENADKLEPKLIRELAKKAGVDLKELDQALAADGDGSVRTMLARDLAESEKAQVGGTPTFFVDGIEVEFDRLDGALGE